MRSRSFITSKNNGFKGQFINLNNNEMINLRGGGDYPSTPTPPGEDFPLDATAKYLNNTITSPQSIPVLEA